MSDLEQRWQTWKALRTAAQDVETVFDEEEASPSDRGDALNALYDALNALDELVAPEDGDPDE